MQQFGTLRKLTFVLEIYNWTFTKNSLGIKMEPKLIQLSWQSWTFREQDLDDQGWSWHTSSAQVPRTTNASNILMTSSNSTLTDSTKSWKIWEVTSKHLSAWKNWSRNMMIALSTDLSWDADILRFRFLLVRNIFFVLSLKSLRWT